MRVKVISVLSHTAHSADDRVCMLARAGVDYDEPLTALGQWATAAEAQASADRVNAMTDGEFSDLATDLANR